MRQMSVKINFWPPDEKAPPEVLSEIKLSEDNETNILRNRAVDNVKKQVPAGLVRSDEEVEIIKERLIAQKTGAINKKRHVVKEATVPSVAINYMQETGRTVKVRIVYSAFM